MDEGLHTILPAAACSEEIKAGTLMARAIVDPPLRRPIVLATFGQPAALDRRGADSAGRPCDGASGAAPGDRHGTAALMPEPRRASAGLNPRRPVRPPLCAAPRASEKLPPSMKGRAAQRIPGFRIIIFTEPVTRDRRAGALLDRVCQCRMTMARKTFGDHPVDDDPHGPRQ